MADCNIAPLMGSQPFFHGGNGAPGINCLEGAPVTLQMTVNFSFKIHTHHDHPQPVNKVRIEVNSGCKAFC